jgi:hypothetical protein
VQLNLNHVNNENMGYGRLGVMLAKALRAKGVEVFDYHPCPPGARPKGTMQPQAHHNPGLAGSVCWVSTPPQMFGWWSTQVPSIFTMWESMRLPEEFRANLDNCETVLVPSQQNVELFSKYHRNVQLVLLGVDPDDWHYTPRPKVGAFFDFLIGGSGTRKGTDLAFAAFKAAFPTASPDSPIPRITFKNPRNEDFRYDGRVTVVGNKMTADDEQGLYASSHCYLQPSRGEGFGLQPLQAIAQGMPTILTDAHGHESFAHLGYGIGWTRSKSAYFMYGNSGDWWEPNLDELVDQMRWVYNNYDEACVHAKVGAEVVARDFTWERTAESFMRHVDCTLPYVEGGEWTAAKHRKYRIRCTETRRVDIAGRVLVFEAGKDHWDIADVKRVLAEAGYLDPVCLDEEDSGLLDEQIDRLVPTKAETPNVDPRIAEWFGGPNATSPRWHAGV